MALPVNFDADSAARIYRAVRTVERGNRDQKPLTFERVFSENPKVFKICLFSGPWATNTYKTVSLAGSPAVSLSALNLFFPITGSPSSAACAVAKSQGTWFVISVPFQTATAVLVTGTAVSLKVSPGDTARTTVLLSPSTATSVSISPGATQTAMSLSGSPSSGLLVNGVTAVLNTANCQISITLSTSTFSYYSNGNTGTIEFIGSGATQLLTYVSASDTTDVITLSASATATAATITGTAVLNFVRFPE